MKELPKVGIAYGYADVDRVVVDAMIEKDYKGIVYAGVGNGNVTVGNKVTAVNVDTVIVNVIFIY